MTHSFNVTGSCNPELHYMVDITGRLEKIKTLIDGGKYFTINRARQYGKTTTIHALVNYLKKDYIVISVDFQMIGNAEFETEITFSKALVRNLLRIIRNKRRPITGFNDKTLQNLENAIDSEEAFTLARLFGLLSDLCDTAEKPVVMIIDEVDSATNNQVFLDFLAQLRGYYLDRATTPTFQSVILAGVYDVKNIKMKIRPDAEHKVNSPWNIAADFLVDMSFNKADIKGMLAQYETDHLTGMDMDLIAGLIYDSTSGYPYLVSRLCQLIDERLIGTEQFPDAQAAWTREGYIEAEKILTHETNTLFDSLTGKLIDYPELKNMLKAILFNGMTVSFATGNHAIEMAAMYGFICKVDNIVAIANRIFETVLYNLFLSEGERQITEYLDSYEQKIGYLLTFSFAQNKEVGVKEVRYGDYTLVEATV